MFRLNRHVRIFAALTAANFAVPSAAIASPAFAGQRIEWSDLLVQPGGPVSSMRQAAGESGSALPGADDDARNRPIELSGFIVPVDREGSLVYQFLLVPWVGACSHVPPPPPDQIVLVTPKEPYLAAEIFEPVTIAGQLRREDELSQLFIFDGTIIVRSGYSVRAAAVMHTSGAEPASPRTAETPWSFLK